MSFHQIVFTRQFFDVLQQWMLKNAKGMLKNALFYRASSVVWVFGEYDTLSF